MQPVPSYGGGARHEPDHWAASVRIAPVGTYDWTRWPGLMRQWDSRRNAGLDISQVPLGLTTVRWYWRCRMGHTWQEPVSSRLAGWPSNPPGWKSLVRSWSACRQCVLLRYGVRYHGCGHLSTDLSSVTSPRIEDMGACPRCRSRKRLPPVGTAIRTSFDPPTSKEEGRLREMLAPHLPLADPTKVNAIVVPRTSWGARWFYPDMIMPTTRVVVEYDSPGPTGRAHDARSHDSERDRLLRGCGWEVIRVRVGGLPAIGPYDVVGARLTPALARKAVRAYRSIRSARSARRLSAAS